MTHDAAPADAPLALTMGEPAGIGAEIALAAWLGRTEAGLRPFFMIDDPERLAAIAGRLRLPVPVIPIASPEEAAKVFQTGLPVLPEPLRAPVEPGRPDPANAPAVIASIERGVELCRRGRAAALVTNPIHKQVLYSAGFRYPGHTEFLAALVGAPHPVMLLACSSLRVVPVTIHLPLKEAIARLTSTQIVETATITAAALRRDFGIAEPRLAVAGLNPHAGEAGSLGREELEIVIPAVQQLERRGIAVFGPAPADSLFHERARSRYDAVICMYHDQALIPLKTIDFDGGVNVTLGLPIIRTSPDHGTAFDIAGSGRANPTSLIASLRLAGEIAAHRSLAAVAGNA